MGFKEQDELGRTLSAGIHGTPELRPDEKRRHLGFFRERVIQALTTKQMRTKEGMQVMMDALKDERAVELVVDQTVRSAAMPLIVQAQRQGLDFTIVSNPNFIGDIAIVLVAKDAVDGITLWSDRK